MNYILDTGNTIGRLKLVNKEQKKSPLIDNPLRLPGQSIDEEIKKIIDNEVMSYVLLPVMMILFSVWNWLSWYQVIPVSNPAILTIIAIGLSVYSYFRLLKVKKRVKALQLGLDGERAVGQSLDSLRTCGFRVFHDIVGNGFNLDHVIVSEYGVFSIETKTYSKPKKGECKIIVNGEGISINGRAHEAKILIQAMAQKSWLEKQIVKLTGIECSVRPVVLFLGWYIENATRGNSVWVLEPKALPAFLNSLPKILSEEQARLISNHISRYIRSTYNENA